MAVLIRTAAALAVPALVLAGCAPHQQTASTSSPPSPVTTRPADPVPLPAAEALADLMNRLADPAVPGAEKLPLLQNGAAPDVITLDRFSAALRDGGYDPAVFTVTDVRGADKPGDALAMVTVRTTDPAKPGAFSFPMEFRAGAGGWQLTRKTAEMLLAFGP
ncbi:MAG TPA: hypothetical protein PLH92_13190 [Mycobacterium sp.]|uniref:hypothetical protein n=1 Tax=Mycolicibacterium sp. TaxID=2320850 RepID=UPI0025D0B695|nr:hypothetical protein [Mycolicibacterium sp.]HPX37647.1 hypothetical protein [Mycobacterium sp.]HQC77662.1 hypothetical protein [Mycobacterium sp.]